VTLPRARTREPEGIRSSEEMRTRPLSAIRRPPFSGVTQAG
jgi:hypothetical protein